MENYSNEITNEIYENVITNQPTNQVTNENVVAGIQVDNNDSQSAAKESNMPFSTTTMIILIGVAVLAIIVLVVSRIKRNKVDKLKKETNEKIPSNPVVESTITNNNQESLSSELGFAPQINNAENNAVNMQPNLGINSNQLNENINSNLQSSPEQVTTMSAILGNDNTVTEQSEIQLNNNMESVTVNPTFTNNNTELNNVIQEPVTNESNELNPINLNESLNINNTELNGENNSIENSLGSINTNVDSVQPIANNSENINVNTEINNNEQNTNVLENTNYNAEVTNNNINQTVVTEEPIINEVNIQMPEVNNIFPDNNVNEVNNIEVAPVNIPVVENNVVNEPISIPIEEKVNNEVVEEKPLSFNNLTENQEMLEKTSVLPNLSQININEINTNAYNSPVMEPKPITLSDIITENNIEQVNNSNIGFGDLTSTICSNCGAKCTAGDMFCVNCGSKLN